MSEVSSMTCMAVVLCGGRRMRVLAGKVAERSGGGEGYVVGGEAVPRQGTCEDTEDGDGGRRG